MSKIVCVFPEDDSINFLEPIKTVFEKLGATIVRGDTNTKGHLKEIDSLLDEMTEEDIFVFMGHGASCCLYGTPTDGGDRYPLFERQKRSILPCKGALLISCRSNEFIKKLKLVNAIGFGDIPATWEELLELRNGDNSIYPKVGEDEIQKYQDSFVRALSKALDLWEPFRQTFRQLYQNIRLCITGEIVRLLLDKGLPLEQRMGLYQMLYDLKVGIDFYKS